MRRALATGCGCTERRQRRRPCLKHATVGALKNILLYNCFSIVYIDRSPSLHLKWRRCRAHNMLWYYCVCTKTMLSHYYIELSSVITVSFATLYLLNLHFFSIEYLHTFWKCNLYNLLWGWINRLLILFYFLNYTWVSIWIWVHF